jgi:acetyl esterase/lipase
MKSYSTLFILVSILLISQLSAINAQEKQDYALNENISYRTVEETNNDSYIAERCKLDIYYPAKAKDFITVVWFHGGGLTAGEKFIPETWKNKGIAVVAVNYRLSPKVTSPVFIDDAAAAVAWVFNHIGKFGGDTSKIVVSGHSAGGYLAAMIGLEKKWLAKYDIDADKIAMLVPFSGQMITHFVIRKERGISNKQPVIDEFAPLYHVRPDAPPLILITGDRELELLGRYEENAYMLRMMKIADHTKTKLYELDGFDHGGMASPGYEILLNEIKPLQTSLQGRL